MKHKHYGKIVAKAANMELVVFCKGVNDGCEWHEVKRFPNWQTNASYFLCLLKNKEACLHWLSGGAIEVKEGGGWETCGPYAGSAQYWSVSGFLMNDEYEYRIKPKKEKRWIGVYKNGATTDACLLRGEVENHPMITDVGVNDWQFIEIEVEV